MNQFKKKEDYDGDILVLYEAGFLACDRLGGAGSLLFYYYAGNALCV